MNIEPYKHGDPFAVALPLADVVRALTKLAMSKVGIGSVEPDDCGCVVFEVDGYATTVHRCFTARWCVENGKLFLRDCFPNRLVVIVAQVAKGMWEDEVVEAVLKLAAVLHPPKPLPELWEVPTGDCGHWGLPHGWYEKRLLMPRASAYFAAKRTSLEEEAKRFYQ